ncbi:MAG: hypothetical protein AW08_02466 [Candidatus Accumulibacter adjunctus]|uniref:NACHT domain-containing protein n=1 Tax=Candidatus Accumulibacter adjunctus TaxID=1454001 RepID=A0A011MVF9_9PROT|nr:MAG: hypothetical protein AW08_02466 [Candidatus Accumulibacter adjunctus]
MNAHIHHCWQRYCLPLGANLNLDADGYLPDPECPFGRHYNPELRSLETLRPVPLLILLGEPGAGKSTLMHDEADALAAAGQTVHLLRLNEYSSTDLVPAMLDSQSVLDGRQGTQRLYLFLDGLDECLLIIPNAARLLLRALRELPRDRLSLRLSCRTAEWPSGLEDELDALWPRVAAQNEGQADHRHQAAANEARGVAGTYELVPLCRRNVEDAARDYRIDPAAFLQQVHDLEIATFASLPNTLRMLLKIQMQNHRLPTTKQEIFREGCRLLADELSRSRLQASFRGRLSTDQRLAIAGRVAAMLLLGSKQSVWLGQALEVAADDLSPTEILGENERAGRLLFRVDDQALKEVLNTALFTARGHQRLGFGHQSWAEYLAADYLAERVADSERLLALLHGGDDQRIPSRLSELTAWLASLSPTLFDILAETEPALLLRGDLGALDAQRKARLLDQLLQAFQRNEVNLWDRETRPHFRKLAHAGLGERLQPWLTSRSLPEDVRAAALQIAFACKADELAELAADLALDEDEAPRIRYAAAKLAAERGDAKVLARLRSLAIGPSATNQELRSLLLTRLWPDHIDTRELFDGFSRDGDWQCLGPYRYSPGKLVDRFDPTDLVVALDWLQASARSAFDSDDDDLANALIDRAWLCLDDPAICQAFAPVAWACLKRYDKLFTRRSGTADGAHPFAADSAKRRRLALAILPLVNEPAEQVMPLVYAENPLLLPEDLPWLLDQYEASADGQQRTRLAACIRAVFSPNADNEWTNRLFEAACRDAPRVLSPLADAVADSIEPIWSGTEAERDARTEHARQLEVKQRIAQCRRRLDPPPAERVQNALDDHARGDTRIWMLLWQGLSLLDDARGYRLSPATPILKMPGWQRANAVQREMILGSAQSWVTAISLSELEIGLPDGQFSYSHIATHLALALLGHERPGWLGSATEERWSVWLPAILSYPFERSAPARSILLRMASEQFPEQVLAAIGTQLDQELAAEHRHFASLDDLQSVWSPPAAALVHACLQRLTDPQRRMAFLQVLLSRQDVAAVRLALSEFTAAVDAGEAGSGRSLELAQMLMEQAPSQSWPLLWAKSEQDPAYGDALWSKLAYRRGWLAALQESQLGDLYLWLEERFPAAADPPRPSMQVYSPTNRDEVAGLRDGCVGQLSAAATVQSVAVLQRLCDRFPGQNWLVESLLSARSALRDRNWCPIRPSMLLQFLERTDARLVRNGAELSDAVLASLARLQKLLG